MTTRRYPAFLLLGASLYLLAGCVTVQVETRVGSSGGGANSIVVGLAQEALGPLGGADALKEIMHESYQSGARVEEWTDKQYKGIKLTYEFTSLDELQRQITRSSVLAQYLQGFNVRQEGDLYIYDLSFSLEEQLFPATGMQFYFAFETPGRIVAYSPQEFATVRSNRVEWRPNPILYPSFQLHAEGKTTAGLDRIVLPLGITLASLLVVAAVVWLVVSLAKRSRSNPPRPAIDFDEQIFSSDGSESSDPWGKEVGSGSSTHAGSSGSFGGDEGSSDWTAG